MEFNQIRYFVVLAETLHFTRAADLCHVSQPALTKAIRNLEDEMGGPLFYRERKRTQLTELGQRMLPLLERVLEAARAAKEQAESFHRRETSPLRLGLEYSVPAGEIIPVLSALRQHRDDIDLSLHQGSRAGLSEMMLDGQLDAALLIDGPDMNARLNRWALFDEQYVTICPSDHRFAERTVVSPQELGEECLLLHEDADCPVRRFVLGLLDERGVKPPRQLFGSTQEQIVAMVTASLGVSVAGERLPDVPLVLRRPIAADPARRTVVLATVAGRRPGPTPALFVKLMRARSFAAPDLGGLMPAAG